MARGHFPAQALLHQAPMPMLLFGAGRRSAEAQLHTTCPTDVVVWGVLSVGVLRAKLLLQVTEMNQTTAFAPGDCIITHGCTHQ